MQKYYSFSLNGDFGSGNGQFSYLSDIGINFSQAMCMWVLAIAISRCLFWIPDRMLIKQISLKAGMGTTFRRPNDEIQLGLPPILFILFYILTYQLFKKWVFVQSTNTYAYVLFSINKTLLNYAKQLDRCCYLFSNVY